MRDAILCIGLTLAIGAVTCPRLSAMTIQFEYGEGLQEASPQRSAVDLAADRWSSLLYDPVVVTIEVAFSDLRQQPGLDENVLAVSRTEDVVLPYFSIDGGHTSLAQLSSGNYNGDGNGPGHWTMGHGLMDPYCPPFTVVDITSLDLLALDVVGWDVVVPEPSSIFSLGIGWLCLVALCNRSAAGDTKLRAAWLFFLLCGPLRLCALCVERGTHPAAFSYSLFETQRTQRRRGPQRRR